MAHLAPMPNVELITAIQKHILEEGNRFIMSFPLVKTKSNGFYDNLSTEDYVSDTLVNPPCGTAACIAGWGLLLSGTSEERILGVSWPFIRSLAAAKLNIPIHRAEDLFVVENWPEPYVGEFLETNDPQARADVAVRLLEEVKRNGVTWKMGKYLKGD